MLARSPGTALISACSTLMRSAAARPSDQLAGMCMCTSTKRRWPDLRVVRWSNRKMCTSPRLSSKPCNVACTVASTSGSSASSIRPWLERQISETPSRRMFSATAIATTASSHNQPVNTTRPMPITTPTDVHTSVTRCLASASSAIERCVLAA